MRVLLEGDRRMRWLVVVAGAVTLLAIVSGVLMAADPATEERQRYQEVGAARESVQTDRAVAQVGQQALTLADLTEGKARVNANLAYMRDEIAKGSIVAADLQARLDLIEDCGVENVALAALIEKAALYDRAIADGHSATDQEVQAAVVKQRELENLPETTQFEGYIKAVGEQRYWSELMPAWQRRNITIGKMYREVVKGAHPSGQQTVWTEFGRQAVQDATIEMLDPDAVAPATLQDALDYLERYWQLSLR